MSATPLPRVDWRSLHDDLPDGFGAPRSERADIDALCGRGAAAYGEIIPDSAERLMRWLQPTAEDCFFDLGSGSGKLVIQVACTTPVRRAVGIELCDHRHRIAVTARQRLLARLGPAEAAAAAAQLEFRREDLRFSDLREATLVYAGATCFPDSLCRALARRVTDQATKFRLLVSAKPIASAEASGLREVGRIDLDMSWADKVGLSVYAPATTSRP